MEELIYFGITFLLIYVIYYFTSIRKAKKDQKKIPIEVQYLILRYKIDTNKISYLNFLNVIAIVASVDIALGALLTSFIDGIIWQLLFGIIFIIPVVVISFMLVGKYYQKQQDNFKKINNKKKGK